MSTLRVYLGTEALSRRIVVRLSCVI